MTYALDNSEKKAIAGPITIGDDDPVTKYQAGDGRTFWAYNGMEVFYADERMYAALDEIERLTNELREAREAIRWIGNNTDSTATRLYCDAALTNKQEIE